MKLKKGTIQIPIYWSQQFSFCGQLDTDVLVYLVSFTNIVLINFLILRCNFDDKTAGFIPMEDRFKFILICAFVAIMAFLVLFFFCRCCCCRKKNPSNNFQQHGDPQRQKKNKKLLIFAILAVPILVFILSLNR